MYLGLRTLLHSEKQMNLQYVSCLFHAVDIALFLVVCLPSLHHQWINNIWSKYIFFFLTISSDSCKAEVQPKVKYHWPLWFLCEVYKLVFQIGSTCGFWFCIRNSKQSFYLLCNRPAMIRSLSVTLFPKQILGNHGLF